MTPSQLADFYQIYFHMPNFNFVQEVIKYVDPSSKGAISAEGFVRLIEIWIYGSFADRMKFCFAVYDYPESGGFLTRYKVEILCRNMVLAELAEDQYDLLASYVDFVFRKVDVDRDGLISYDDYAHVVTENPKLLQIFGPVIPDLEEMGAILGQAKADPLP
ncbi:EF-hand calcium-binding domain-containing protein 1-like isoform X2 [Hermetia illucens]|nr:EF-hand calcium-binding domain-containing protein 1-like isoform X2 [Hermetia illucens]